MVIVFGNYQLDDEPARIDRNAVWSFLSEHAYWGHWRTRRDLDRQMDSAWRMVGVYDGNGQLVGFARAVSDGVALAYLADTYIVAGARSQGLGKELIRVMIECGSGAGFRWTLHTATASALPDMETYRGDGPSRNPDMETYRGHWTSRSSKSG